MVQISLELSDHFADDFGHGRVWEDYLLEFAYGIAHTDRKASGSYELGAWVAYHMYTKYCLAAFVHNDLAKAHLAFVLSYKATGIGHRQLVHLIRNKWFVGGHGWRKIALLDIVEVFLGQSDACDLWVGINDTRDSVISDALEWQLLEHTAYSYLGLSRSDMGEHDLARDIACGIDVLEVCVHEIVYHNATTVDLDIIERL